MPASEPAAPKFGDIFGPNDPAGHRYTDPEHQAKIDVFLRRVPKVREDQVQFFWIYGFYDGPLSGLCLYQGQKCWFHALDWITVGKRLYERFVIIELDPKTCDHLEQWRDTLRHRPQTNQAEMIADGLRTDEILKLAPRPVLAWFATFVGDPDDA